MDENMKTRETGYSAEIMQMVQERTNIIAQEGYDRYWVGCDVSEGVEYAAAALQICLDMRAGLRTTLTDSDIEKYLTDLGKLRCLSVNRQVPKEYNLRDILVPDFFRPVLSALGIFDDPRRALEITPAWFKDNNTEVWDRDDDSVKAPDLATPEMTPQEIRKVGMELKRSGIPMTMGMPTVHTVREDDLFRIHEEDGELLVAGLDVTHFHLLVRSAVRIGFARDIYGAPRTRYISVEELRSTWDEIVGTAVPVSR